MRAIYTCRRPHCKASWSIDYDLMLHASIDADRNYYRVLDDQRVHPGDRPDALCPRCGKYSSYKRVVGVYSATACDWRCRTARLPQCTCSCGGKNHGGALKCDDPTLTGAIAAEILGSGTAPASGQMEFELTPPKSVSAPLDDLFDAVRKPRLPEGPLHGLWDDDS